MDLDNKNKVRLPLFDLWRDIRGSGGGAGSVTSVLHVHVVGDAKAGKSLAVKWMIHMLEARNRKTIEMR